MWYDLWHITDNIWFRQHPRIPSVIDSAISKLWFRELLKGRRRKSSCILFNIIFYSIQYYILLFPGTEWWWWCRAGGGGGQCGWTRWIHGRVLCRGESMNSCEHWWTKLGGCSIFFWNMCITYVPWNIVGQKWYWHDFCIVKKARDELSNYEKKKLLYAGNLQVSFIHI